jgi:NitT/TauT family transport system substrate-binding protein
LALSVSVVALAAGCGDSSTAASKPGPAAELRLGYFANVTHAGAVYGVQSELYEKALGSTRLSTQVFNAGPAAVEALFAGSLDAAYIGPNPAINAFVKSNGKAIRIIAGATSGGAALVVRPDITDARQLKGKKIADPQTGGTQDIALRTYLKANGYEVDASGAGDVTIVAQENASTLDLFRAGKIDGAWVPEPWASRLVLDGGGSVLVDEKTLWPGGRFVTTNLVVRTKYLEEHPETVKALLAAQVKADDEIQADATHAQEVINAALKELTGKALKPAVLARAFDNIEVTEDPLAASLRASAEHAFATGLVKEADLTGIYDLTLLRQVLGTAVDDAGLGRG